MKHPHREMGRHSKGCSGAQQAVEIYMYMSAASIAARHS